MWAVILEYIQHVVSLIRSDWSYVSSYNDMIVTKDLQQKYVPRPFAIVSLLLVYAALINTEVVLIKISLKWFVGAKDSLVSAVNDLSTASKIALVIGSIFGAIISLALSVGMGAVALHIVKLNQEHPEQFGIIIDQFFETPSAAIISCGAIGVAAFLIRSRLRLWYAIIEFAVGVYASYLATDFHDRTSSLQFAAGLYIIVRSFDNLEKALEENPVLSKKILPIWRAFFHKRKVQRELS
jgi:hypothetical protein